MRIKILGSLGEDIQPVKRHRKHSGILINNLLFDAGEVEFFKLRPKAIFITHLHPDHLVSLDKVPLKYQQVAFYSQERPETKEDMDWRKIKIGQSIELDNYKITVIPTSHSKKVKSNAFIIEKAGTRILYTGDMIWIKKKYHNKLKNLDLVITDGSFIKKKGMIRKDEKTGEIWGHAGIPDLIRLFKGRLKAKRIIFTHFGDWLTKNPKAGYKKIKELGAEYAYDGKVIELSSLEVPNIEAIKPKVIAKPEARAGKILVAPHGDLILEGKKKAILSTIKFTKYIREPVFLIQDNYALGIIELEEPSIIENQEEFEKNYDTHRVSLEEFEEWNWKYPLYMYPVRLIQAFKEPLPIVRPKGPQVWIEDVKFVKELGLEELVYYHALLHIEKLNCLCSNLHNEIVNELETRGYNHPRPQYNILDRIYELIKDAEAIIKNPSIVKKLRDAVVRDDWRIIITWSKRLKAGKRFQSPQFKDKTLEEQKAIVKKLYEIYKKEMIRRGFKAKAKIELVLPETMQIKDIDPEYLKKLDNDELTKLHEWIHEQYRKLGLTEDIYNADVFIMIEMFKRGLIDAGYIDKDDLDKLTRDEWLEYGLPEARPTLAEPEEITLENVLEAFRRLGTIEIKGQPFASYLTGRIVNLGKIPKDHDIDLLFRQAPDPRLIRAFKTIKPEWLAKRLHLVFDKRGPYIGFSIPVHGYALNILPRELQIKGFGPYRQVKLAQKIKVGKPLVGLKPKAGLTKHEWWLTEESWLDWGKDNIKPGIFIEEKVDGRRFQIHYDKAKNLIKIFTEDRRRDRAEQFPELVNEIKKLNVKNLILDGEIVVYEFKTKIVPRNAEAKRRLGDPVPREDTGSLTVGTVPEDIRKRMVYMVYDILYLNDKPLVNLPYKERRAIYLKLIPKKADYLLPVRGELATDMRSYFKLVNKYRNVEGSEGNVMKRADSIYPVKFTGENRTGAWAKIKNLKEIDVLVLGVVQKKTKEGKPLPTWMYQSYYQIPAKLAPKFCKEDLKEYKGKIYARIGRSYSTGQKAKIGDIITVRPIRIRDMSHVTPGKCLRYTWMFPYFDSVKPEKKEPDTLTTVERLERLGTRPLPEKFKLMNNEELNYWLENPEHIVIRIELDNCPFWNKINVCPLRARFLVNKKPEYLATFEIEELRFPVACPLADIYKCKFIKDYYYNIKQYEV